jgi:hypothetical protein
MNKNLITLVFCVFFILNGMFSVFGQKKEVSIQDQKITIQADKQPLGKVFRDLMENYNISIGFEESILDRNHSDYSFQTNSPSVGTLKLVSDNSELNIEAERAFSAKEHKITLNIRNGKLSKVLDKIVSQMINYRWEISDGVINIIPIRGRDERFNDLLETKIDKFDLEKGKTVNDITLSIVKLREFRGWLRKNKLHFNLAHTGSSILLNAQYGRKLDESMSFSNLSFRELLNEITKIKKGGWILKQESVSIQGDEYIKIDI